ncbi:trypsin-3-like [Zophobas morio]|uniref:trypsin-3-like n=1 Tax=Zophobas morio TaxID=2755281 RepID=UPI003083EC3B
MKSLLVLVFYLVGTVLGSPTIPLEETKGTPGDGRIIGGYEVTDSTLFPHQIALMNYNNDQLFCGGSLLSEIFVLTAAHCVYGRTKESIYLRAGNVDLYNIPDVQAERVLNIFVNPYYNPPSNFGDLAILKTTSFTLDEYVWPVRLPVLGTTWSDGTMLTATGWGRYSNDNNDVSPLLKAVDLSLVSAIECEQAFPLQFTYHMLCMYGFNNNVCNGDSGGPVIATGSTNFLVGVVSFGAPLCATTIPDVIINVAHPNMRMFINETTGL